MSLSSAEVHHFHCERLETKETLTRVPEFHSDMSSVRTRKWALSHFNFLIIFLKPPPATLVSLTEQPRPGGAGGIDGPAGGGEEYANICSCMRLQLPDGVDRHSVLRAYYDLRRSFALHNIQV